MTRSDGMRFVTTSLGLAAIGLVATLASVWVLTETVHGRALFWAAWLSVLGAFVAVPITTLLASGRGSGEIEPRR